MSVLTSDLRSCSDSVLTGSEADHPYICKYASNKIVLENVCLSSFVKTDVPGLIFDQASKIINYVFSVKMFWCKSLGLSLGTPEELGAGVKFQMRRSVEGKSCVTHWRRTAGKLEMEMGGWIWRRRWRGQDLQLTYLLLWPKSKNILSTVQASFLSDVCKVICIKAWSWQPNMESA